jgi:hypothetical protein
MSVEIKGQKYCTATEVAQELSIYARFGGGAGRALSPLD